jgi:hypothetical protein
MTDMNIYADMKLTTAPPRPDRKNTARAAKMTAITR